MPVLPRLGWERVCARRLRRHGLDVDRPGADVADVAATICGAHAQVLSAAEVSLGLRVIGATRADVRDALWTRRSLVKARGPRGTVHLLAARDLPMWTGALAALPVAPVGLGEMLTASQTDEVVAAIADVLADAELTTDELTAALVERLGSWAGDPVNEAFQGRWPRWTAALVVASNRGALCYGPNKGRKISYTNPQRWLPGFRPAAGERALADVVRRYVYAYGPATPAQLARWLAAPVPWATEMFDALGDELEPVEVEGARAWVLAGDTEFPDEPHGRVRLLPYFDAYTVGCHPRELLFAGRAAQRALAGGQAGNYPVLLVGATVAGVWHQRRSGRNLDVTVEPLGPLTSAQRGRLDAEVERVAQIQEARARLTIGPVSVGPHA